METKDRIILNINKDNQIEVFSNQPYVTMYHQQYFHVDYVIKYELLVQELEEKLKKYE